MTDEKNYQNAPEHPSNFRKGLHNLVDVVANGLESVVKAGGKAVDEVVEAGQEFHKDVQSRGGYAAATRRLGEEVGASIQSVYAHFEDQFLSDGEFDSEKAKKVLENGREGAKKLGIRTYDELARLSREGAQQARKSFRDLLPDGEERQTKYAGIGTARVVLFRKDFDSCLEFYNSVSQTIPETEEYRARILDDIKASGSASKNELGVYYTEVFAAVGQSKRDEIATRLKVSSDLIPDMGKPVDYQKHDATL